MEEWKPAYRAKLENIVGDTLIVKAVSMTDACMLITEQPDAYRYTSTIEKAGEKSFGLYVFQKYKGTK